jgi:hypothetical protein
MVNLLYPRQQKTPAPDAPTHANEQVLFSLVILFRAGVIARANANRQFLGERPVTICGARF